MTEVKKKAYYLRIQNTALPLFIVPAKHKKL